MLAADLCRLRCLRGAAPAQRRSAEAGDGDLRRRLLLVRGGRFRQGAGRDQHDLGLHRRQVEEPDLQQVSAGGTGHAEAVEIVYDPAKVSYAKLLDVFWRNIDPLAKDRQFCDSGDQYRTGDLLSTTRSSGSSPRRRRSGAGEVRAAPVYTEIVKAGTFYKAEDYHQDYYEKNRSATNSTAGIAAAISAWSSSGASDKSS